eukprot:CAMPEP_0196587080 /NCGR_PEP_ID=MMETSP1081-20130531/56395_1 /TAXON_ID=36882 /ORGANISM="Pyramimonas amylifera, Strain CCMP720" /LENGTH=346 /DNA_ID=CAMNT_0041909165 /DNA_START=90 /DNA_END=1130 /DNA_ORIENTATION=-
MDTLYNSLKCAIESQMAEMAKAKAALQTKSEETLARIQDERRLLEEEKSKMKEVMRFHKSKIKLDVGGCKYTTSLATLTSVPDSMLGAMFSGRFPLEADAQDGSFFIDRDGQVFKYILNFLREPVSFDSPLDKEVTRDLLKEAKYFGLLGLVEVLQDPWHAFKKAACCALRFTSPTTFDGALNYIATAGGCREWVNPVEDDAVEIQLSDGDDGGGDPVECMCDHDPESGSVENCYDGQPGEASFALHLKGYHLLADHYLIAQEDGDDNYLRDWVLEGSDDGFEYEEIQHHVDFSITAENLVGDWAITPVRPFSFFRVRLLGASSGAKCNFCVTQFEIWGHVSKDIE